jgi:hypothetical protein
VEDVERRLDERRRALVAPTLERPDLGSAAFSGRGPEVPAAAPAGAAAPARERDPPPATTLAQRFAQPAEQPATEAGLMPLRTPLRIKLARRCRRCVEAGRPGILLQPEINPQHGDSSFRTHVGRWHKKQSLAWSFVPHVRVVELHLQGAPASAEGDSESPNSEKTAEPTGRSPWRAVSLRFSNPSVFASSPVSGEMSVRLLSLDAWAHEEAELRDALRARADDADAVDADAVDADAVDPAGRSDAAAAEAELTSRTAWERAARTNGPRANAEATLLREPFVLGCVEDLPSLTVGSQNEKASVAPAPAAGAAGEGGSHAEACAAAEGRAEESAGTAAEERGSVAPPHAAPEASIVHENSTSVVVRLPIRRLPGTVSDPAEPFRVSFAITVTCAVSEALNSEGVLDYTVPVHLEIPVG